MSSSICTSLIRISNNPNILDKLTQCLQTWDYKSIFSIIDLRQDIEQVVEELIEAFFGEKNQSDLSYLLREFVHREVHDTLFYRIKELYHQEDLKVYQKSIQFCKNGGAPKQLGQTIYNFIPSAAVVELSMLNNKQTPKEKLDCLQTTYDYIFAEVKAALISVISKYSDKEVDLPLINNKEVTPIVTSVILKSKLFYFMSDMAYIEQFSKEILDKNPDLTFTFGVFKESLSNILQFSNTNVICDSDKLEDKLSVCDTINFVEHYDKIKGGASVLYEERSRVARLITVATTEGLDVEAN